MKTSGPNCQQDQPIAARPPTFCCSPNCSSGLRLQCWWERCSARWRQRSSSDVSQRRKGHKAGGGSRSKFWDLANCLIRFGHPTWENSRENLRTSLQKLSCKPFEFSKSFRDTGAKFLVPVTSPKGWPAALCKLNQQQTTGTNRAHESRRPGEHLVGGIARPHRACTPAGRARPLLRQEQRAVKAGTLRVFPVGYSQGTPLGGASDPTPTLFRDSPLSRNGNAHRGCESPADRHCPSVEAYYLVLEDGLSHDLCRRQ